MPKRSRKLPRDINQRAKAILDIVTGETTPEPELTPEQQAAAILGRKGGLKGGKSRAEKLTSADRKRIAKKAAEARWKKT